MMSGIEGHAATWRQGGAAGKLRGNDEPIIRVHFVMTSIRTQLLAAACTVVALAAPAAAQDNYEIQVYPSTLVGAGRTMVELHSNYTFSGLQPTDGSLTSRHALHETVEITRGFSSWFELGFYFFTSKQAQDVAPQWVGFHLRPRVSVPEEWHWPVGLSFSNEFGVARAAFSPDTWTWEIRPIIDQKRGAFYWSVNPSFDLAFSGPDRGRGAVFAPNAKVSWDLTSVVAIGAEYYGAVGRLGAFDPRAAQQHQLFPAIDLDLGDAWEFNVGVGVGLTPATDRYMTKLILGRRFGH